MWAALRTDASAWRQCPRKSRMFFSTMQRTSASAKGFLLIFACSTHHRRQSYCFCRSTWPPRAVPAGGGGRELAPIDETKNCFRPFHGHTADLGNVLPGPGRIRAQGPPTAAPHLHLSIRNTLLRRSPSRSFVAKIARRSRPVRLRSSRRSSKHGPVDHPPFPHQPH